jgi:hypothetical protein
MKTTECDKLHAIKDQSQVIGEFLDWLEDEHEVFLPKSVTNLLAEYFDIDLEKVEQEKLAILEDLRER